MKHLLRISVADFKLIFRDPSLRAFLAFPFILFGLIVWFLPEIIGQYENLRSYTSLFLIVGVVENTQMFSFISSMVLIDEKETGVAQAYGIVPVSKVQFLLSRLLIPFMITVMLNVILLMVQPFFSIDIFSNLIISVLTALVVPVYVLGINTIVKNRMEGLIYVKAFNLLVLLPMAAFFVPDTFKHFFGIFPTYWIFLSIQQVTENQSMLFSAIISWVFFCSLLLWLSGRVIHRHFV